MAGSKFPGGTPDRYGDPPAFESVWALGEGVAEPADGGSDATAAGGTLALHPD